VSNPKRIFTMWALIGFACLAAGQESTTEATKMKPEIVELEEMTVVGFSSLASMKCNLINKLWERFMSREKEIKNIAIPGVVLEVSFDMEKIGDGDETEDWLFFDLVGLPAKDKKNIPEGMTYKVVPAHRYAKFTHKGTLSKIMDTYNYIYVIWLPQSGYEYDPAACGLEWFDERFKLDEADSEFDIYVPIKNKKQ
jgi:AraC family transcriptional regulator